MSGNSLQEIILSEKSGEEEQENNPVMRHVDEYLSDSYKIQKVEVLCL